MAKFPSSEVFATPAVRLRPPRPERGGSAFKCLIGLVAAFAWTVLFRAFHAQPRAAFTGRSAAGLWTTPMPSPPGRAVFNGSGFRCIFESGVRART
jgi:hypothetical protein